MTREMSNEELLRRFEELQQAQMTTIREKIHFREEAEALSCQVRHLKAILQKWSLCSRCGPNQTHHAKHKCPPDEWEEYYE